MTKRNPSVVTLPHSLLAFWIAFVIIGGVFFMETEIWKDIPGYETYYQVSNLGRIKSLERFARIGNGYRKVRERIRRTYIAGLGYKMITLKMSGVKSKMHTVHRFVATCFIPNPNNYPEVNHIDGNKLNAKASNLEWVTHSQNQYHAYRIGLKIGSRTGKPATNCIPVVAIRGSEIIEFPNLTKCFKTLKISSATACRIRDTNEITKSGFLIKSI